MWIVSIFAAKSLDMPSVKVNKEDYCPHKRDTKQHVSLAIFDYVSVSRAYTTPRETGIEMLFATEGF